MAQPKVFYKKSNKRSTNFDIATLMGKTSRTSGEIGIEIEVEGNKFKKESIVAPWVYHKDGSLRGQDNAEYVLSAPILFSDVPKAVENLWKMFSDYGSVLDESNRTSVHVHLNMQNFYLNRLCSFMAMYFSIEEILTAWCGEHRIGNLFCLRAKDAPAIVTQMKRFIRTDANIEIRDGMHYAGLNTQALAKFGSLEIRSLRGVKDPAVILNWVSVLERLYKLSDDYPDPRVICDQFSGLGPMEYLHFILGDLYPVVRNNIEYDNQQIMEALYDGIRLAQDLCYCRDWSKYKPHDLKADPFGRRSGDEDEEGEVGIDMAAPSVDFTETYEPSPIYDDDDEDYPEDEDF